MIIDHKTIDHHDQIIPLFIDGEEAGSACKKDSKDPRKNIVETKIVI